MPASCRAAPLRSSSATKSFHIWPSGPICWAEARVAAFGAELGRAETLRQGELANRFPPELKSFDRFGHRIDEVEFHPAYHYMMQLGVDYGVPSLAWSTDGPGGHVAHTAMEYMLFQVEAGVCCPLTMTYAAVPALRAIVESEEARLSGYAPYAQEALDAIEGKRSDR